MSERYSRHPNTVCSVCGIAIYRRPCEMERGRVFCGKVCNGHAARKEHPCVVCKKPILAGLNKKTCSRACANKNRIGIAYKQNRPKDKVVYQRGLKLRLINAHGSKCERCGYAKVQILQVHHKDRNRTHNTLDNLELICPNCHMEEHHLEKSWLNGKIGND